MWIDSPAPHGGEKIGRIPYNFGEKAMEKP
jgi:hypothetical protein